jgi:hypothetical protein
MRHFFLKRWVREIKQTFWLLYTFLRDFLFGETWR